MRVVLPFRKHDEFGTAFFVEVGTYQERRQYLVTAGHVIAEAEEGSLFFLTRPTTDMPAPFIEFRKRSGFSKLWHRPADDSLDLAIAEYYPRGEIGDFIADKNIDVVAQPLWDVRDDHQTTHYAMRDIRQHYAPLEEVLFVGYPEGLWDPDSGFPIVRRGVSATPIDSDYRSKPVFLIDAAVMPGSRGSPVVVADRELVVPSDHEAKTWGYRTRSDERFVFLGMITDLEMRPGRATYLNLGVVLKASAIFDFIAEYEKHELPS